MSINYYSHLSVYGSCYSTTHKLSDPKKFVNWTEENFQYKQYNPRKDIQRYGLSITSLDGGLSGIPDLDSIPEYNRENNTLYSERDFNVPTPVLDDSDLLQTLSPIKQYLFRSHVLKIGSGGFFPPHRDFRGMNLDSFRLIIPLQNLNPPAFIFSVDGNNQYWNYGFLYFVDTAKMHYLFNMSFSPSYLIVLNVELNETTINFVTENLKER